MKGKPHGTPEEEGRTEEGRQAPGDRGVDTAREGQAPAPPPPVEPAYNGFYGRTDDLALALIGWAFFLTSIVLALIMLFGPDDDRGRDPRPVTPPPDADGLDPDWSGPSEIRDLRDTRPKLEPEIVNRMKELAT